MKLLTSSTEQDIVLIEIEGAVDAHTARELGKTLNSLLAQGHHRLVLEASRMSFISSAGLKTIMFAQLKASKYGGQVRLCGLNAHAQHIFEIVGFDECLHICDTQQDALEGW